MPSLVDFAKSKVKKVLRKKKLLPADPNDPEAMEAEPAAPGMPSLELDQKLEDAATPNRPPISTPVRGIMKKSGLLSMIRNRGNRQVVDPEKEL